MKIYVITRGDYSDYRILAATDDKKKAELYASKFDKEPEEVMIEEYDSDDLDTILKYQKLYRCSWKNGEIKVFRTDYEVEKKDFKVSEHCKFDILYVTVDADNEAEALKIASEKFAKYRAEKMGL